MNYSIDHRHRDADLFGLLYGFSFRPGERGREIESAEALQRLDVSAAQARAQGAELLITPEMYLTGYAIGTDRVAALAEIDEDELFQLNPAFKKRMTVDGPQQLLVPTAKAQLLTASLSNMKPEELLSLQPQKAVFEAAMAEASTPLRNSRYKVKRGDNLASIAKANRVSVKDLQRWNKLRGNSLKVGQTLVMQSAQPAAGRNQKKPTQYKVRKGDSLYLVAKRFNVEMKHLKRWNPRSGHALKPGQTLTVYLGH